MLDSVIGTFLTQNVSDQLSSKAYMTLAAKFPARPSTQPPDPPATPSSSDWPDLAQAEQNSRAGAGDCANTVDACAAVGLSQDAWGLHQQLVATDGADISDAVDWEAVRTASPGQVGACTSRGGIWLLVGLLLHKL